MNKVSVAIAKLAGVLKAAQGTIKSAYSEKGRPTQIFSPAEVKSYFESTSSQLLILRTELPDLYGDFAETEVEPKVKMSDGAEFPYCYALGQIEKLARDIEQVFELRANSELAVPVSEAPRRVFVTHGRANDWTQVQNFIERDLKIQTLELAQEPNQGRTLLQKLEQESSKCSYAVIVMTGDDFDSGGNPRARENVMHEIGYFQGKFGLSAVCLLHEEGTSIPSNIHGLAYAPFPKGYVSASFGVLMRELNAYFK